MGVETVMIRASVAMATYNGERFLKEQMDTILVSLGEDDELVISDDGSTDKTRTIVEKYIEQDKRIRLIEGPKNGVKKNFENAIRACRGEYIFLSDQDDIWDENKIQMILNIFSETGCSVVVHDNIVVEEDGKTVILDSFFKERGSGAGAKKNIWKNTYIGCCMAFKRELLDKILPIPNSIEMHDQWIGVINDLDGTGTVFIPDKLILYRRHGTNASSMSHYGIGKMIRNRLTFIFELRRRRRSYAN